MPGHEKRDYRITLEGQIFKPGDERLDGWSFEVKQSATILIGKAIDSPALYGAIAALRDHGLVPLNLYRIGSFDGKDRE